MDVSRGGDPDSDDGWVDDLNTMQISGLGLDFEVTKDVTNNEDDEFDGGWQQHLPKGQLTTLADAPLFGNDFEAAGAAGSTSKIIKSESESPSSSFKEMKLSDAMNLKQRQQADQSEGIKKEEESLDEDDVIVQETSRSGAIDFNAIRDDPIAALEAAIEDDKPKYKTNPEWQRMIDAMTADDASGQLGGMVPEQQQQQQQSDGSNNNNNTSTTAAHSTAMEADNEDPHNQHHQPPPSSSHPSPAHVLTQSGVSMDTSRDSRGENVTIDNNSNETTNATANDEGIGNGFMGGGLGEQYLAPQSGSNATLTETTPTHDGKTANKEEQELTLPVNMPSTNTKPLHTRDVAVEEEVEEDSELVRKRTFSVLQPICSVLLSSRDQPEALAGMLQGLTMVMEESDAAGLQQCFMYAAFPLLLAVDSIAATRSPDYQQARNKSGFGQSQSVDDTVQEQQQQQEQGRQNEGPAFPAMSHDAPSEAALQCLLCLLRMCHCFEGDQLIGLLYRLSGILACPPGKVSEEIRLLTLHCSNAALESVISGKAPFELQAALQLEGNAMVIGHLSSLLLQVVDSEARAGPSGSKAVRVGAFTCLLNLITATNSAEALSFFLPGILTGLARALLAAVPRGGVGASGPASSADATVIALEAFIAMLKITLNDGELCSLLGGSEKASALLCGTDKTGKNIAKAGNVGGLEELQAIAARYRQDDSQHTQRGKNLELFNDIANEDSAVDLINQEKSFNTSSTSKAGPASGGTGSNNEPAAHRLRVERSGTWVTSTAERACDIVNSVLPLLVNHPSVKVRAGLATGIPKVLESCLLAMNPCSQVLLEQMLVLAQDEWPQVNDPARHWLERSFFSTTTTTTSTNAVLDNATSKSVSKAVGGLSADVVLEDLIHGLVDALRKGDVIGCSHARKLATCLQACGPSWIATNVLLDPVRLDTLLSSLVHAMRFDPNSVRLLLHAAPDSGTTYSQTASGSSTSKPHSKGNTEGKGSVTMSAALLPRMPLALELVTTPRCYAALADVCRTLAAAAVAADSGHHTVTALRALVDGCLRQTNAHILAIQKAADIEKAKSSRTSASQRSKKKQKRQGQSTDDVQVEEVLNSTTDAEGAAIDQPPQLVIASAVVVLQEVLFGASPCWSPSWKVGIQAQQQAQQEPRAELELLTATVLEAMVQEDIWALPTSAAFGTNNTTNMTYSPSLLLPWDSNSTSVVASIDGFAVHSRGIAHQLGCNVALQKMVLELIGTAARSLGTKFSSNGRLMRTILLPLLEKLSDPSALVASSATTAVTSVCSYCGYAAGGLRALAAANADYIVDGVCKQLRQPSEHPRAPQLLAALLRQAGVAAGLLPLLAEPARRALQGISIVARTQQPEYVLPFLAALQEISGGALAVGNESAADMTTWAASIEAQMADAKQQQQTTVLPSTSGVTITELPEGASHSQASDDHDNEVSASSNIEDIKSGFESLRSRAKSELKPPPWEDQPIPAADNEPQDPQVLLSHIEWDEIQLIKKRAKSAAVLAQSVADCAGPLSLSSSLHVAVGALRVCNSALQALHATTVCLEEFEYKVEPAVRSSGKESAPSEDDSKVPKLLPSVHLLWSPLMAALQDWRISVAEAGIDCLNHLTLLAGGFLKRRFATEAWPNLARLLTEGPSTRKIIAPGQDDTTTPATLQRARLAVLSSLKLIAESQLEEEDTCKEASDIDTKLVVPSVMPAVNKRVSGAEGNPSQVLIQISAPALTATARLLADAEPAVVREAATRTFIALARVDADAAWALLVTCLKAQASGGGAGQGQHHQQQQAPLFTSCRAELLQERSQQQGQIKTNGLESEFYVGKFPSSAAVCPPLGPEHQQDAAMNPAKGCSLVKLQALLAEVERTEARWHREIVT